MGCECIAHVVQTLMGIDEEVSINGMVFFLRETEMRKVRAVNNQNWASGTKQS